MLTPEAIELLSKAEAISAARSASVDATDDNGLIPLPNDFTVHDIERQMPARRRARGTMRTSLVANFASYVTVHGEDGAAVFVNPEEKKAVAVLNLGSVDAPGHADNLAIFEPRATAAYTAMKSIANGLPRSQTQIAEFLEDWRHVVQVCRNGETELAAKHAIAAVRSVTIEALRKVDNVEGQLSASRSALESVKARSAGEQPLPAEIVLVFVPFQGLPAREFVLRLAVHAGDKPTLTLRIAREELHDEEMAAQIVEQVRDAVDDVPVFIGSYKPSP